MLGNVIVFIVSYKNIVIGVFLYKKFTVEDFSVREDHSSWFFEGKIHCWKIFLYEKNNVDDFSMQKVSHSWLFYTKQIIVDDLLYEKFFIDNTEIIVYDSTKTKDHRWWFFNTKKILLSI